jgi:hypothetical protein
MDIDGNNEKTVKDCKAGKKSACIRGFSDMAERHAAQAPL